jgi:hypothetical protein
MQLFFPPKWGINNKIPNGLVLGLERSRDTRVTQRALF